MKRLGLRFRVERKSVGGRARLRARVGSCVWGVMQAGSDDHIPVCVCVCVCVVCVFE